MLTTILISTGISVSISTIINGGMMLHHDKHQHHDAYEAKKQEMKEKLHKPAKEEEAKAEETEKPVDEKVQAVA